MGLFYENFEKLNFKSNVLIINDIYLFNMILLNQDKNSPDGTH